MLQKWDKSKFGEKDEKKNEIICDFISYSPSSPVLPIIELNMLKNTVDPMETQPTCITKRDKLQERARHLYM